MSVANYIEKTVEVFRRHFYFDYKNLKVEIENVQHYSYKELIVYFIITEKLTNIANTKASNILKSNYCLARPGLLDISSIIIDLAQFDLMVYDWIMYSYIPPLPALISKFMEWISNLKAEKSKKNVFFFIQTYLIKETSSSYKNYLLMSITQRFKLLMQNSFYPIKVEIIEVKNFKLRESITTSVEAIKDIIINHEMLQKNVCIIWSVHLESGLENYDVESFTQFQNELERIFANETFVEYGNFIFLMDMESVQFNIRNSSVESLEMVTKSDLDLWYRTYVEEILGKIDISEKGHLQKSRELFYKLKQFKIQKNNMFFQNLLQLLSNQKYISYEQIDSIRKILIDYNESVIRNPK